MTYKIISIIFLAIIVILIGLLICFFALNYGSNKLNQTLVKIVGFLAAALVFIFLDIFSVNNELTSTIKVLMPRSKYNYIVDNFSDKLTFIGSDHVKGYSLMSRVMLFSKYDSEKQFINENARSLDIVEMTFWQWMSSKYHLHWQVVNEEFIGIQGGGSTGSKAENANDSTNFISYDEMSKILKDNILDLHKGFYWGIHLPYNSNLTVIKSDEYERTYLINTKNIETKISIRWVGNSGIEHSKLGDSILKDLPKGEWYSNNIRVKFETKTKRARIFSVETKNQIKWIYEIQDDFYNDFDWSLIKVDLEKAYLK
ncbi:MAG: hypothetical protein K8R41_12195 [Bacteroidales bacterium]|nr:hypothetical protein [Bacteroidales bacterium]